MFLRKLLKSKKYLRKQVLKVILLMMEKDLRVMNYQSRINMNFNVRLTMQWRNLTSFLIQVNLLTLLKRRKGWKSKQSKKNKKLKN